VIEPNPNSSIVGLRDYKNDWPRGPVTTAESLVTGFGPKLPNVKFHLKLGWKRPSQCCKLTVKLIYIKRLNSTVSCLKNQGGLTLLFMCIYFVCVFCHEFFY